MPTNGVYAVDDFSRTVIKESVIVDGDIVQNVRRIVGSRAQQDTKDRVPANNVTEYFVIADQVVSRAAGIFTAE